MISDDGSSEVRLLTYLIIQTMIEKTKRDLHISINFRQIYEEACKRDTKNKYDYSNLEIRQHVRDILLRNGCIFVNPDDAEDVFVTEKAVDQYE